MPNYKNGKIYKLWSLEGDDIYIGSTTQSLAQRKGDHLRDLKNGKACNSKLLFEKYNDVKIELLEEYPCENKEQLVRKEGEYIRNNGCVNKRVEGRTRKEYREDNKDKIKEQKREYYEDNKNKIKERDRKYYEDNKNKIKEHNRKYREDNKNKIKEHKRKYCQDNKEKVNEYQRKYYEDNKDKINERRREKKALKKELNQ